MFLINFLYFPAHSMYYDPFLAAAAANADPSYRLQVRNAFDFILFIDSFARSSFKGTCEASSLFLAQLLRGCRP